MGDLYVQSRPDVNAKRSASLKATFARKKLARELAARCKTAVMTNEEKNRLARIGYAAYGKTTDFKNYQGLPMPEYDNLPPKIREAWENTVEAVREAPEA